MPISVYRPVEARWPITGEYLQTSDPSGIWTPDHPHLGVDFGCPIGTAVYSATVRGKVVAIHRFDDGWGDGSFGLCIIVDVIGTPWYYLYAHLSATYRVKVDDFVEPGQQIALSGASGKNGWNTYAPHLHTQASTDIGFPRANYLEITGDPILGLRAGSVVPPTTPDYVPTIGDLNASVAALAAQTAQIGVSLNNLNGAVIDRDNAHSVRIGALESQMAAILSALGALAERLPKG